MLQETFAKDKQGRTLAPFWPLLTTIVTVPIPELLILQNVLRWQPLAMFFGIIILGYIFSGIP